MLAVAFDKRAILSHFALLAEQLAASLDLHWIGMCRHEGDTAVVAIVARATVMIGTRNRACRVGVVRYTQCYGAVKRCMATGGVTRHCCTLAIRRPRISSTLFVSFGKVGDIPSAA